MCVCACVCACVCVGVCVWVRACETVRVCAYSERRKTGEYQTAGEERNKNNNYDTTLVTNAQPLINHA